MTLTGKAKTHFEDWYPDWVRNLRNDYHKFTNDTLLRKFDREVLAMKWGVYQDFFAEHGIYFGKEDFDNFFSYNMADGYSIFYDTREETLQNVIRIYNAP